MQKAGPDGVGRGRVGMRDYRKGTGLESNREAAAQVWLRFCHLGVCTGNCKRIRCTRTGK